MNNIDIAVWIMAVSSVIDTIYTLSEMIHV
jgi:hypothetical protein